jgi:hypothetical protein
MNAHGKTPKAGFREKNVTFIERYKKVTCSDHVSLKGRLDTNCFMALLTHSSLNRRAHRIRPRLVG